MPKYLFIALFIACGLSGCADVPTTSSAAANQSAAAAPACSTDEPSTGSRLGKKRCS
ncbi:hypothetical protein GTP45_08585 [Pseudoduganella sp. FT55W]|uniref:Lipoprotein n=1 Tax=Duganella rivi TaxID=2666083 RepID=A0A7X4GQP0_9BURK|nr:hypothetical protein [Duganella rivi]MYM66884.1 hypothetical protein [Duganella rivi]